MKHAFLILILAIGLRPSAEAAYIYSGVQDIAIPTTFDGVYLDIDNGSTSASPILGWDVNFFFGGLGIGGSADFQPARVGTGNMDRVIKLATNDVIDASLFYSMGETGSFDHLGMGMDQFEDGVAGYLGFRFTKNDFSGPFYGYMRLTLTANTPGAVIHDWAWDDTGAPITIPEPSRAMLLLFASVLSFMRRRR